MTKQYGIDPRLVIWIQRNTGHDLQTFSDLAKIKCLDSRRRNFSAVKKIEDMRLPSWLMIKENDFSLIGEMVKLKQLSLHDVAISDYSFLTGCRNLSTLDLQDTSFSDCRLLAELPALKKVLLPPYSQMKHTEVLEHLSCLQNIKEENAEEPKAAEQPGGEGNPSEGSPASERPLHLGDTAHLSIDGMGIVLYSPEVMKSVVPGSDFLTEEFIDPKQVGEHIRKGDITAFCTGTGGDFILWLRSGYPDSIAEQEFPVMIRLAVEVRGGTLQFCDLFWLSDWNPDFPQDQVLSLADGYYHITACTKRPESGYWGDDQIVCLYFNRLEEMPKLAWQGVPHLFTEEQEADPQDADAQRQPFGLYGWLGMDMSFYSNAADNLAVVMDCGDLQVLYGAASQEGYRRLMKVMEGLGQAM